MGKLRFAGDLEAANGRVDAGPVASGSYALRVRGNDQSNVRIRMENSGTGGASLSIVAGEPGASNDGLTIYNESTATVLLRVTAAGVAIVPGVLDIGIASAGFYAMRVRGNDQSNARIRLQNTGSGGGIVSIVAGDPGASNDGLTFYNESGSAVLLRIALSGAVSIPGAFAFNGKTPIANVAAPTAAGSSFGATEQALLNDIRTRLINLGVYT